jgi:hypothetical protein
LYGGIDFLNKKTYSGEKSKTMKEQEIVISQKVQLLLSPAIEKQFGTAGVPFGEIQVNYLILYVKKVLILHLFKSDVPHVEVMRECIAQYTGNGELQHFGGGKMQFIKSKTKGPLLLQFTGSAQYIGQPMREKIELVAKALWPGCTITVTDAIEVPTSSLEIMEKAIANNHKLEHGIYS